MKQVYSTVGGNIGKCDECKKENKTLWQRVNPRTSRGEGKQVCGICKQRGALDNA
jgi:hypothetical protein